MYLLYLMLMEFVYRRGLLRPRRVCVNSDSNQISL
jgi:hypothetical protein